MDIIRMCGGLDMSEWKPEINSKPWLSGKLSVFAEVAATMGWACGAGRGSWKKVWLECTKPWQLFSVL